MAATERSEVDGFTPAHVFIEFDMVIDTPCGYISHSLGTNPEGVAFYADGSIGVGTPAGGESTTATWTSGQAFRLGFLSLEEEFFVYVNGIEIANIERSSQFSDLPVDLFYFSYGAGGAVSPGTIMIDNVLVTPEPATLLLVVAGLAFMRKRR